MATQKGRNWSSGDIVTAANLQSIERGVSSLAEEYTPTTWANGNTVTAAALNNIEQGIVDGGSSDFSTAQVTLIATVQEGTTGAIGMISVVTPYIAEGYIDITADFGVETKTLAVVMYGDGGTPLRFIDGQMGGTYIAEEPVATGDITFDEEKVCYVVTGDGTISIVLTND